MELKKICSALGVSSKHNSGELQEDINALAHLMQANDERGLENALNKYNLRGSSDEDYRDDLIGIFLSFIEALSITNRKYDHNADWALFHLFMLDSDAYNKLYRVNSGKYKDIMDSNALIRGFKDYDSNYNGSSLVVSFFNKYYMDPFAIEGIYLFLEFHNAEPSEDFNRNNLRQIVVAATKEGNDIADWNIIKSVEIKIANVFFGA